MSSINLKTLVVAMFALLFVAGCSTTDSSGGGDSSDSATSYGTDGASGVGSSDMSGMDGAVSSGNTIYFDFDSASIRSDSRSVLNSHAARLKKTGDRAVLEGHADERGTREYNMALGERRAKSVANYLATQGISSSQLDIVSYGEERPAVRESSESGWAMNRRVEIR